MPGESLDAALGACPPLQEKGMGNILTYLGENVASEVEAVAAADRYLEALDAVNGSGMDVEVSVKLTQLGLDQDGELCHRNLVRIAERASATGNFLWIDMEASPYVDRTLDHFRRLRESFRNVGICLQAYLFRTERDLEGLLPLSPAIRVVKGAYAESREIAYPRKGDVDASFLRLAATLLHQRQRDGDTRPAFATHDPKLIAGLQAAAERAGVGRDGYEFQLLYGIQREQQERLAAADYRLRVLISYGEAWFPWFMRRLAERPGNLTFVVRNLFR